MASISMFLVVGGILSVFCFLKEGINFCCFFSELQCVAHGVFLRNDWTVVIYAICYLQALVGLSRSETVKQIISKLPIFINGHLQGKGRSSSWIPQCYCVWIPSSTQNYDNMGWLIYQYLDFWSSLYRVGLVNY